MMSPSAQGERGCWLLGWLLARPSTPRLRMRTKALDMLHGCLAGVLV
jgi:hypothetical protein